MTPTKFTELKSQIISNLKSIEQDLSLIDYDDYLELVKLYINNDDPYGVAFISLFYIKPEEVNKHLWTNGFFAQTIYNSFLLFIINR